MNNLDKAHERLQNAVERERQNELALKKPYFWQRKERKAWKQRVAYMRRTGRTEMKP